MNYQSATHLHVFMYSLGAVYARSPREADDFARKHGLYGTVPAPAAIPSSVTKAPGRKS
jgi:hypothetical protein